MALIDTALETVRETLEDVVDVASTRVEAVTAAISDVTEDERSRKGLVILIVVALLAIIGIVVWRRASSSGGEAEDATAAA
jgi:hypothetical protein